MKDNADHKLKVDVLAELAGAPSVSAGHFWRHGESKPPRPPPDASKE